MLVVEDTADIRELLAEILGAEGYDVVGAANGAEALEALQTGEFQLVLLDLMMPIMNGFGSVEKRRIWGQRASSPSRSTWTGCCRKWSA